MPTSSVPVSCVEVVHVRRARGERRRARRSRSSRSSGRNGTSRRRGTSRRSRLTASSISSSGFGARDAPVGAHRQDRARRPQRAERVLPAPALGPRNGIVSSSIWSSWAAHSGCALATTPSVAEPADVVGMDDLDVGDVRARVGRAVRAPRRLDRVERLAHRAVADGVEVRLEPERVERGTQLLEAVGVDHGSGRGCRSVPPWPSRYGSSIAPVKFSRTPSMHELHARRRVAADRRRPPALDELLDLLGAAVALPPQRADDARRSARRGRPARRRRAPSASGSTIASCQAVIPSACRWRWPRRSASSRSSGVSSGRSARDEVHGALVERARTGVPSGSRSIRPSAGSGVSRGDPGELERPRVDPGAVAVAVRQEDRPVGHDPVEVLAARGAAREVGHVPAAAADPRLVRVGARVCRDLVVGRRPDCASSWRSQRRRRQPAVDRVDVRVRKPGRDGPAAQVDDPGRAARSARATAASGRRPPRSGRPRTARRACAQLRAASIVAIRPPVRTRSAGSIGGRGLGRSARQDARSLATDPRRRARPSRRPRPSSAGAGA